MTDDPRDRRRLAHRLIFLALLALGTSVAYRFFTRPEPDAPPQVVRKRKSEVPVPASNIRPETPAAAPLPLPAPPATPPAKAAPMKDPPRVAGIHGVLHLPDGSPAPFAQVDVFVIDLWKKRSRLRAETDEKGRFILDCPRQAFATFTAHLPGYGRSVFPLSLGNEAVHDFGRNLFPEAVALGVVKNADVSPCEGARLRFHPYRRGSSSPDSANNWNILDGTQPPDEAWDETCLKELFLTDTEVTTNAAGEFSAASLMPGIHYIVEVLRDGQESVRYPMSTTRKNPTPAVLVLPP